MLPGFLELIEQLHPSPLKRLAMTTYGIRNFENYRMRGLTHCGWDGIINRVQMNAHPLLSG